MIENNDLMLKIKKNMGEKEIEKDNEIFQKMKLESKKEEEEENFNRFKELNFHLKCNSIYNRVNKTDNEG